MRVISFYPPSRNMKPHIDEHGEIHVPISEWLNVLRTARKDEPGEWVDRDIIPSYPTNGTIQQDQG